MLSEPARSFIGGAIAAFIGCLIAIVIASSLSGCETISDATRSIAANTNRDPDQDEHLFQKDPDLWWHVRESGSDFPQDDRLHWSGSFQQIRDKDSGAPIGWQFGVSMKCAWPRIEPVPAVLRPPIPAKTYPPLTQEVGK
jgi:hypothetical protein